MEESSLDRSTRTQSSRVQQVSSSSNKMPPKNGKQAKPEQDELSENEIRSILIGKDGNLSRDFEAVLTKLFISFLENPTDKALTLENLKKFSMICNDGKPFSDEEIKEIQTYFQCDENKGLTLKGFKDMYHTQSSAEPMETWRDMKKLGFDKDLLERRDAALRCRVCKAPSSLVCSRCKVVRYCGADCQKADWKNAHKKACKPAL